MNSKNKWGGDGECRGCSDRWNAGVWEMQGPISQYQRVRVMDRNMDCDRQETWEGGRVQAEREMRVIEWRSPAEPIGHAPPHVHWRIADPSTEREPAKDKRAVYIYIVHRFDFATRSSSSFFCCIGDVRL